jgi:hypothetical protein
MKEVLSFGAGVQSTTLLLMSCKGVLPKLDHVIFADTQWEPAAVYRHLEWCKEYAAKHGIKIDVRTAGNLRQDLLEFWGQRKSADGKRHASIPAFIKNPKEAVTLDMPLFGEEEVVWLDSDKGMVRRQCTGTYKIEVIERYVREEVLMLAKGERWPVPMARLSKPGVKSKVLPLDWVKDQPDRSPELVVDPLPFEPVRQWIGISTDEIHRMKASTRPALAMWHPLIEAAELQFMHYGSLLSEGYSRDDCKDWLTANGFKIPTRSACRGCPFRTNAEWRELTPEEFADACDVDRLIRRSDSLRLESLGKNDLVGQPYLHASLLPLSEVDLKREDQTGQGLECECTGGCGT